MTAKKKQCFDPGQWGYYRNILNGEVMEGFLPDPPQVEDICGEYKIVFAASLTYSNERQNAKWHLRRRASGSLLIVNSGEIQGLPGTFFGKVVMATDSPFSINRYFGDGYNVYGTGKDARTYGGHCCTNCMVIKTLRNNNVGRLYVVSERKAFPRIKDENGWMGSDNPINQTIYESQEHETMEAERICRTRHYSFLCRKLGFSCAVASHITQFAEENVPYFFFAEPGDIWIDIKLSTPTRTYVLARRDPSHNWQSKFIHDYSPERLFSYLTASPQETMSRLQNYWRLHRNHNTFEQRAEDRMTNVDSMIYLMARSTLFTTARGRNRSRQVTRRRRNNRAFNTENEY